MYTGYIVMVGPDLEPEEPVVVPTTCLRERVAREVLTSAVTRALMGTL